MDVIIVRHGEADYSYCIDNGWFGLGLNLAPLTSLGQTQANKLSYNSVFEDAQLIVSSPYTRALQTASIISTNNNIPLVVEPDLHEWIPDLSYQNNFEDEEKISNEFLANEGLWSKGKVKQWEPIDALHKRVFNVLDKYLNYKKIVIVTHAVVMYHLTGFDSLYHCRYEIIDYSDSFEAPGWFNK